MFKKIAVSAVLFLTIVSFAQAGNPGSLKGLHSDILTDTAGINDSTVALATLNDPKQGFKDLFVAATLANGISAEQLNPMAVSFVQDYITRFGDMMEDMKDWGRPYFDMMDAILVQHGLPIELKYLAVIESHLKSNARSWAGAVGPWQLMPATARTLGLRVSKKYDERRDYYKSTHAASKYLTDLYEMYGDWLLVIAAYNGGPGRVNSAIKRSGSKDFWVLQNYLPAESRNHVKKFIATHYIMEGQGGVTTLGKDPSATYEPITAAMVTTTGSTGTVKTQTITGRYNSKVIAKFVGMEIAEFNRLNPTLDRTLATTTTYQMKLPEEKMQVFFSKKNDILNESVQMLLNPDYKL